MVSQISGVYIDKYSTIPYFFNIKEGCEIIDISPSVTMVDGDYFDISYLDKGNITSDLRDYEIIIAPVYHTLNHMEGYKYLNKFETTQNGYVDRFFVFIKKCLTLEENLLKERSEKIKKVLTNQ